MSFNNKCARIAVAVANWLEGRSNVVGFSLLHSTISNEGSFGVRVSSNKTTTVVSWGPEDDAVEVISKATKPTKAEALRAIKDLIAVAADAKDYAQTSRHANTIRLFIEMCEGD